MVFFLGFVTSRDEKSRTWLLIAFSILYVNLAGQHCARLLVLIEARSLVLFIIPLIRRKHSSSATQLGIVQFFAVEEDDIGWHMGAANNRWSCRANSRTCPKTRINQRCLILMISSNPGTSCAKTFSCKFRPWFHFHLMRTSSYLIL